jgi:hypothetical protein
LKKEWALPTLLKIATLRRRATSDRGQATKRTDTDETITMKMLLRKDSKNLQIFVIEAYSLPIAFMPKPSPTRTVHSFSEIA